MGIAAYNRGTRALHDDISRKLGERVPGDYPERKPVPRPPEWGQKVLARALKKARWTVRFYASRGEVRDSEWIADSVRCDSDFSEKCAREATRIALEEFDRDAGRTSAR